MLALLGVLLVAGCTRLSPNPVLATAEDGRGAIRPLSTPTGCTVTVTDPEAMNPTLAAARPGSRVCLLGNLGTRRLMMGASGTKQSPIQIIGDGNTIVRGITVEAHDVTISGINSVHPIAPGISLRGDDLTLTNSTSISPRGGDGDGIRFWGTDITITHNTIRDTRNLNGAHADCMQTFATDDKHVASQHVIIAHNRCEQISNICLIAEGPNSLAGDGSGTGQSADLTFADNYCDNYASEATELDDVQHATITGNHLVGEKPMAFSFQNKATGALVQNNLLASDIDHEVGMDDSCRDGYFGPIPGGGP